MKLRDILNEDEKPSTDEIRKLRAVSAREHLNLKETDNFITCYHGTSVKNAKNIIKTKLRSGAWASTDYEVAKKYSERQAHGGEPYVMQLRLYIGSLVAGTYITTQEDLFPTSVGFVPKDLMRKVYDL